LKEHIEVSNTIDIDTSRRNYSNSTAIKILNDIAKSPVDSNVSKCLIHYYSYEYKLFSFRVILFVTYVYVNFTIGNIIRSTN